MKRIFICSPFAGNTIRNIQQAQHYCRTAVEQGHNPLAPHLFYPQFLDDSNPAERELGLRMGLELLSLCEEMWVFGKPSPGMTTEIDYARSHGIPVNTFPEERIFDDE